MIASSSGSSTAFVFIGLAAGMLAACASGSGNGARHAGTRYAEEPDPAANPSARAADRQLMELSRLDRASLVRAVVARNPSVESAKQAYRAARARQPQAEALPDPMLMYEFAPLSIGSSKVPYGHTIQLSQSFPWPGKLSGRGEAARSEAAAMREQIEVVKLDLALEASELYDDYWLIARSLEITAAHEKLLRELAASARAQYEVGRGSLQDPLQAEVELTHVEHQALVLRSQRQMAVARMNALLHRRPEAPLPGAPEKLGVSEKLPARSQELQKRALASRSELRSAGAKVRAAQSSTEVAEREYYPDFTLSGTYTTMFMETEHQWMVGLEFPIPVSRGGRGGAVDEASAQVAEARSEVSREVIEIRSQVDVARLAVVEAIHVVRLYRKRLLPVARAQVAAARSGYQTGSNDFQAVVSAERNLRDVELAYLSALAELSKRRARLTRALGEMPGVGGGGER